MEFFRRHRTSLIMALVGVLGVSIYLITKEDEVPAWVTTTVETGVVRELVSVSGIVDSRAEAELTFPVNEVVESIPVREGALVTEGETLATLHHDALRAQSRDALAALLIAEADKAELLRGPRSEARAVTNTDVDQARATLSRTETEVAQAITHARRTFLSSDLEAVPINKNTRATPPEVSGTYTCDTEGTYTITFYRSDGTSGYSYRLSGLETGTFTAYHEAPGPLGTCGLMLKITEGDSYGNAVFTVSIPNKNGGTYVQNLNAYESSIAQYELTLRDASLALERALREEALENAAPIPEAITRKEGAVLKARAQLDAVQAQIQDHILRAPFSGTVSTITLTEGEVSTGKSLTLVGADAFELRVRIPEIDITSLSVGQHANVRFDADPSSTHDAVIAFIAKTSTEIDGVAYFEAALTLPTPPSWLRSGLNADVDIVTKEVVDTLRIPRRFLVTENNAHYLLYPDEITTRRVPVELVFDGNDGYVAISGDVRAGDTVIAP